MPLPTFLVIGANRAGTSSLHAYLGQHPDVYMSSVKEPMFFSFEGAEIDKSSLAYKMMGMDVVTDLAAYEALFAGQESRRARGESSTSYLPNIGGAAARIRQLLPEVRMLGVLRNPVERALSAYWLNVGWGLEPLDFEAAIDAELNGIDADNGWKRNYVELGRYGRHLAVLRRHFQADQLRIFLYEDLQRDPRGVLRTAFDFIGVDPNFEPLLDKVHNPRPEIARYPLLASSARAIGRYLPAPAGLKRGVKRALNRWNRRDTRTIPVGAARRLHDIYAEDIRQLEELMGRTLESWRRP